MYMKNQYATIVFFFDVLSDKVPICANEYGELFYADGGVDFGEAGMVIELESLRPVRLLGAELETLITEQYNDMPVEILRDLLGGGE